MNHAIRDFANGLVPRRRKQAPWQATHGRRRQALWISSPIGLGHVQRDLAIARAVRKRVPDLEIHWWAQLPVTDVLAEAGEVLHPASSEMASESAHWESEAADHDLPAFYAFRRMDEIFCATTCCSTTLSGTPVTTCGWAMSAGRSITSCTRTRSGRSRRTCS